MQFVHASSMQRKISEDCYDVPLQCDMWINAELIRTIEMIDDECYATTKNCCYLIDKVAEKIQDIWGIRITIEQKGE